MKFKLTFERLEMRENPSTVAGYDLPIVDPVPSPTAPIVDPGTSPGQGNTGLPTADPVEPPKGW